MLVLTRRAGEEIVIAGDIRIRVVAVLGNRVRIGVKAPPFVRVDRQEIHEQRAACALATGPPDSPSMIAR